MASLRPMGPDDVAPAVQAFDAAFDAMRARHGLGQVAHTPADHRRKVRRVDHLRRTDPAGSWVAEEGGLVVGLSQATVREGLWMLSLLGVAPDAQRRGTGRALLAAAMTHGDPAGPASIQASRDPAAVALYVRAGFELHPAVGGAGRIRHGALGPDREARGAAATVAPTPEHLSVVADVDRQVRGAARTVDLAFLLGEPGNRLLLDDRGAYAVATEDRIVTLGGRDEAAATRVLEAALCTTLPGVVVQLNWITAPQQWALRVLVALGVDLHPTGPLMLRGRQPGPAPYLPSGGYG